MSQQPYQQQPNGYGTQYVQNSPVQLQGGRDAQTALICGIVGLFFFGIVLGPIAIVKASAAERNNVPATAGKVLGWISTIFGVLSIIIFIFMMIGMAGMAGI